MINEMRRAASDECLVKDELLQNQRRDCALHVAYQVEMVKPRLTYYNRLHEDL